MLNTCLYDSFNVTFKKNLFWLEHWSVQVENQSRFDRILDAQYLQEEHSEWELTASTSIFVTRNGWKEGIYSR